MHITCMQTSSGRWRRGALAVPLSDASASHAAPMHVRTHLCDRGVGTDCPSGADRKGICTCGVRMRMHMHICTHVCTYTLLLACPTRHEYCIHACIRTCTHAYMHAYVRAHMHTCMHTHMHMPTYIQECGMSDANASYILHPTSYILHPTYIQECGMSDANASTNLSLLAAGSFTTRVPAAIAADRYGRRCATACTCACMQTVTADGASLHAYMQAGLLVHCSALTD